MTSVAIPENVRIWKLGGKSGNLRSQNTYASNTGYHLFCRTNNSYLTWKKTNVGINLGYTADGNEKKVHLRLQDGGERDILSGETVAFGIGGKPAFLRYAKRTMGINLDWAENPVYQWRIYGADTAKGKPIPAGSFVAIVNEKVEPDADFLIYLDRPAGADVGWTTSPDWRKKWLSLAMEKGLDVLKKKILE